MFTTQEIATIMAALRYWQHSIFQHGAAAVYAKAADLMRYSAQHYGREAPLTMEEIDSVCERLPLLSMQPLACKNEAVPSLHAFPYFGTVSHGTMRNEDLIPCFLEVADDLIERGWFTPRPAQAQELEELRSRMEHQQDHDTHPFDPGPPLCDCTEEYWPSEVASEDCHWLFELLDEIAPPKHYFGAHEGDGSDYGFWRVEDDT